YVFNPYALSCGHLFCKSCACSSASVLIFDGLREASPKSKCPTCREVGVYSKAVHMLELDMLLKRRCKDYWKERLTAERVEMLAQSKLHWTKIAYGLEPSSIFSQVYLHSISTIPDFVLNPTGGEGASSSHSVPLSSS
ncbi:hypothetical protein CMV_028049, partial [Castanea mollissima]